jgi:hypothetical protein
MLDNIPSPFMENNVPRKIAPKPTKDIMTPEQVQQIRKILGSTGAFILIVQDSTSEFCTPDTCHGHYTDVYCEGVGVADLRSISDSLDEFAVEIYEEGKKFRQKFPL